VIDRLRYEHDDMVDVGYVGDFYALLRAVEALPKGAVLCLEGTATAADVVAFVEARQRPNPPSVERNTRWPTPHQFHLPLECMNLQELCSLAEQHAEPKIADHLVVYRDDWVLMWAHDAGADHVRLSRRLPPDVVARFKESLGSALRPET
jgi:hypothetical protein